MPSKLRVCNTNEELIKEFESVFKEWGSRAILVTGKTAFKIIGNKLDYHYGNRIVHTEIVNKNSYSTVQSIDEYLFLLEPSSVISIGGGKVIDIGKLIAHRWRLPFISVPTQVAHDGIASPIAVIEDVNGRKHSIGASMPDAVVVSLELIKHAPLITIKSGIGDLLANLTALFDWKLATSKGYAAYDDYAAIISRTASLTILNELERGTNLTSDCFLEILIESLILSGIAMNVAGSSRPASGAEHLLSHAIDELYGGVTLHGVQVALCTLLIADIQGQKDLYERLFSLYKKIGLPIKFNDISIKYDGIKKIINQAPMTRPERYTILNEKEIQLNSLLLHNT